MLKWVEVILDCLAKMLTPEERRAKEIAAKTLGPMLQKQLKMEKEQYKIIVSSLQQAGIFPDRPTGKRREGYLEMQKADGSWKKYYFVLFKDSLSYFNLDDKVVVSHSIACLVPFNTNYFLASAAWSDSYRVDLFDKSIRAQELSTAFPAREWVARRIRLPISNGNRKC
jgi:hypothetical protein